jgi:hypothetical protein
MIVIVRDGAIELYKFDSEKKAEELSPAQADIEDVKRALRRALRALGSATSGSDDDR